MNPYSIDISQSNLEGPFVSLNVLHEGMPATSGCETCKEVNGDNYDWCCLLPEVLVYSELGPIPIKDIKVRDKVWTKSGLRSVVRVGKRKISEKIVDLVSCYGRTMSLTVDHEVLIDQYSRKSREKVKPFEFFPAGSLIVKRGKNRMGHYFVFPKFNGESGCWGDITISEVADVFVQNGSCFNTKLCKGTPIDNNFGIGQSEAWIFGLYFAEGCTEIGSVNFNINEDETELFQRVMDFAKSCGVNASWKINRGKSLTIRVFSRVLVKLFDALCGKYCDQKRISSVLMQELLRDSGLRQSFMDGYYAGDGTKKLPRNMEYSIITTSKELAHQTLFLNWSLGRFCGLYTHSRPGKKTSYTINHSDGKYHDYIETENDFRVPVRSKEYRQYNGYVFDIEIENEESFLTECGEVHNCKKQSPSMYYVEFLKIFKEMGDNWTEQQKTDVLLRSVRNYLDNTTNKGCVFYDDGCTVYKDRPFNCRMYGVIPQESWGKRWESLKERQGDKFDAHSQCSLVSSDREITPELEDKWFLHTRECEERIGISKSMIDLHDEGGGSYRNPHDHLVLELLGEEVLAMLTNVRLTNPSKEDIELTIEKMKEAL